ncbi:MAG: V-type ATP synthase subunit E [Eubacterium sp.]|nr:V-type ATP synthase subunit E [Eubacterium sp.]
MAGIEKITNEIQLDAEKEAAGIIEAAENAAKKAREDAIRESEAYISSANEKLDKKRAAEEKKILSQCEHIEKLKMLETRQEIIEDTLLKAKNQILDMDAKEYFDLILSLLEKRVLPEKGLFAMNSADLKRVPADFASKINAIASKDGGELRISDSAANINGGFILKYGNIEINSSVDALFDEHRDEFVDIVNKVLFL